MPRSCLGWAVSRDFGRKWPRDRVTPLMAYHHNRPRRGEERIDMPVPLNILEPVEGWRNPAYFPDIPTGADAPEGALPTGPITASFGVSADGKLRWNIDGD